MFNRICNVIFIVSLVIMLISCVNSRFTDGINISCKITVICIITFMIFKVMLSELFN